MKKGKELDMENQKDLQQEQTLSQESLPSLEEEQLQDVTGGGIVRNLLSCFVCGKPEPQPVAPRAPIAPRVPAEVARSRATVEEWFARNERLRNPPGHS